MRRGKSHSNLYGLIKQIDDQIGVLMEFLKRGPARHHDVVFTSDHGDYRRSLDGREGSVHDQSANPADCARSIGGGRRNASGLRSLVEAIDLAPTSSIISAPSEITFSRALAGVVARRDAPIGARLCSRNTTIACRKSG
jgi:arylsulfatase A-like enzyme